MSPLPSNIVHGAGAVLAFLLELAVYAAAGYWAFTRPGRWPKRLALAVAAVVALIVVWGLFGAPSATYPLHGFPRAVLELCWFGSGALALLAARRRPAALIFVVAWVVSTILNLTLA